jgi:hypothetical protein
MDARQLAFLDAVEEYPSEPRSDSTGVVKRIGAVGAGLAAATAFLALTAGPASANAAPTTEAGARPAAPLAYNCLEPNHTRSNYNKGCYDGTWVEFHFVGENACGPGGQNSIYYFDRIIHNPCTGDVEQLVATNCF